MFVYNAYGITIKSNVSFDNLRPGPAKLQICELDLECREGNPLDMQPGLRKTNDSFICGDSNCTYIYNSANNSLQIIAKELSIRDTIIVNMPLYPAVITHGGMLMHASAVQYDRDILVFSGDCKSGKSTLSLSLKVYHGCRLLCDDASALGFIDGRLALFPGVRFMKSSTQTLKSFGISGMGLSKTYFYEDKYFYPMDDWNTETCNISFFFIKRRADIDKGIVRPITGFRKQVELIRGSIRPELFRNFYDKEIRQFFDKAYDCFNCYELILPDNLDYLKEDHILRILTEKKTGD